MRSGELVRLKQPFEPTRDRLCTYRFGQVVTLVTVDVRTAVLLHLCDRQGNAVYTDENQQPILYSFWLDEVEGLGDRANNTASLEGIKSKDPF